MAVIGAIQAGVTLTSSVINMLQGKDPERQAATDQAYAMAVAGDANALLFLRQRTGNYGIVYVPGYGEIGGWGSPAAKSYAAERYAAALSELKLMGQLEKVEGSIGGVVKGVAREAGYEILPQWMIWTGLAVLVGVVVFSNKPRSA